MDAIDYEDGWESGSFCPHWGEADGSCDDPCATCAHRCGIHYGGFECHEDGCACEDFVVLPIEEPERPAGQAPRQVSTLAAAECCRSMRLDSPAVARYERLGDRVFHVLAGGGWKLCGTFGHITSTWAPAPEECGVRLSPDEHAAIVEHFREQAALEVLGPSAVTGVHDAHAHQA